MVGQSVAHYRITEKLGEGGRGVVIASKILPAEKVVDPERRRGFVREGKTLAQLHASGELPMIPRICLVLLVCCATGTAQVATARLEGVVRDASGAVVPSASIAVVNNRTQVRARTASDPEGLFAFPSLQPSIYTLTAEAAGFRTTVVSSLELTVGATVSQSIHLEVGAVADSVVVRAPAERVQIADAQVSRAITMRTSMCCRRFCAGRSIWPSSARACKRTAGTH